MAQIRVLVIDDSAFMRKVISDIINGDPDLKVVGTARDGQDGLVKIRELQPDVVTLDIEMPRLDGLGALEQIMRESPVPVIMLSSLTKVGAEQTLRALQLGAIDFITKPSGQISLDIEEIKDEIVRKVKTAAGTRKKLQKLITMPEIEPVKTVPRTKVVQPAGELQKLLLIGTSTGGPKALYQVIPRIHAHLNAAVLVVQHMPAGFTRSLAERLDALSGIRVKEAEADEPIENGCVYIAPGDYHLLVAKTNRGASAGLHVHLNQSPPRGGLRPAFDVLLESVAQEFWGQVVCVIMTGMGHDGAEGIKNLKKMGARIIAEDQSTCIVFGMPKAAIETGLVDKVVPLTRISDEALRML